MAYPVLDRPYKELKFDKEPNVISDPLDAGYVSRRPRFTRTRRTLTISYDAVSDADLALLLAHEDIVGQSGSFVFTDKKSNTYTVYYLNPLKYKQATSDYWEIEPIMMREV